MDRESVFNHCQAILSMTNDGDDLAASDLNLVEGAINEFLSPRGYVVLYQLRYKIENKEYEIPWFCGVENLTRGRGDDRSVFWRGMRVEHYDHDFWQENGWQKRMTEDAQHLGKVCQYLEANGIKVSLSSYIDNSKRMI